MKPKIEIVSMPLSGEKRVEITLGSTIYSMTVLEAFDLASEIIEALMQSKAKKVIKNG